MRKFFCDVPTLRFREYTDEWVDISLSSVADIIGGGTPDTSVMDYWNGNIQWYTPTEVGHTKYVSISERKISKLGVQKSSAKLLPKGTILLSSRATIGECSIAEIECATNQGFQNLVPFKSINNEFLYYLTQTKKRHFIKYACGSTFLEISNKEVKKTKCTIPSLDEQAKIAKFLSLIDKRIETQNKIIKRKKSLIFSLVIEIVLAVLSLIESIISLNIFSFCNNLLKLLWTIFKEVKRLWSKKKT